MRGFYLNVCFGSVMLLRERGLVVFETYRCGVVVGLRFLAIAELNLAERRPLLEKDLKIRCTKETGPEKPPFITTPRLSPVHLVGSQPILLLPSSYNNITITRTYLQRDRSSHEAGMHVSRLP